MKLESLVGVVLRLEAHNQFTEGRFQFLEVRLQFLKVHILEVKMDRYDKAIPPRSR